MKQNEQQHREPEQTKNLMSLWSATAIGMGAMIGAGIFALIGIAVELAGTYAYVSFILAGLLALLTAYSMSKLAAAFPKKGGTVSFLNKAFGKGSFSGSMNLLTCLGYLIVTSLYARAFGEYGLAMLGMEGSSWLLHLLSSGIVLLFVGINFSSAAVVGKAGLITTIVQTAILLLFGIIGVSKMEPNVILQPESSPDISGIILCTGIVFMSYEGFGLVANTAEDIRQPKKNLPRSLYISVLLVMLVYALVNIAVVGNMPTSSILEAKEYVLAEAASIILGKNGFLIMGAAALFSTSSAINSTIYGPVYMVQATSEARQLPPFLQRGFAGHDAGVALALIGALILIASNTLDLSTIAETGSLVFLVVYAAVNFANFRLYKVTNSSRFISLFALLSTLFALGALGYFLNQENSRSLYVFFGIAAFTLLVQLINHFMQRNLQEKEPPKEEEETVMQKEKDRKD